MITVAQIGCGYWGPNLLRNYSALDGCRVKWVAESSESRREFVQSKYPETQTTADVETLLGDDEVDAVIIATPARTHFELARAAMQAGKHVFVEKPLALNVRDADELIEMSQARGLTLMVGHTFLYNPAVRVLKDLIDSGELGEVFYFCSQRLNLGQLRDDVNAWWNLAPHDVSMLLYLMDGRMPVRFSGVGQDFLQEGIEDVVFATMEWREKVSAMVHVSWLDPNKVRKLTVVGSQKMAVYDDVADSKIAVYDRGFDKVPRIGERMDFDGPLHSLKMRSGDIMMPSIPSEEPLAVEARHFIDCVGNGTEPLTGGKHARAVLEVVEKTNLAMRSRQGEARFSEKESK